MIVSHGEEQLQLRGVLLEAGADKSFNFPRELGIAGQEPAAEGDAVGFVVELLGIELVEVLQFAVFQNFGVQRRHAVGGVGEVDVHVGHVDSVFTVDDGGRGILRAGAGQGVQLFDDGHELGHHLFQIVPGPLFQGLRQNGVVRVGTGPGDDVHRLVEADAPLLQQADQLRDDHAGVGVIDLDGGVVRQVVIIAAPGGALVQQELGAGADHEILLVNAQQAARLVGVIGIEEQCQVLTDAALVEGDAIRNETFVHGVQVEQVQGVGAAVIAGDGQTVQPGLIQLPCQLHGIDDVRGLCPALVRQPQVRRLGLEAVPELLTEQSAVVPQADAVAGQVQRCQRVQEAGGQAAQTAVAQAGLRLQLLQVGQGLSGGGQTVPHVVVEAQVDEVIGEQFADEELGGDIVQLSAGDRPHPVPGTLLHKAQQSQVQFLIAGILDGLAAEGGQLGGNRFVHKSSSRSEDFACIFTLAGILYPY